MNAMDMAILVIGSLAALILAIAGLFRPFLGLLVFLAIHFVQPGELVPAIAPFRVELVYGLLLILAVLRKTDRGPLSLLSDRILFAMLPLIVAGALSVPFAIWPGGAAQTVIDMIKLVTFSCLLKLLIDSEPRLRNMLWCMAGVAAWFAGSSLFAFIHGEFYALRYDWGTLDRAQGLNSIVGGPNELAGVLLALLPLLLVLLRTTLGILPRILLIAIGALSLAAVSLTGSRIAIIALIAMGLYYTFQSKRKLLTCAACLVIGILIWENLPSEYKQRYLTVESYAAGGELDGSNELRLEVWRAGWQIFSQYPIVGVGAGQFANAYGMIYLAGRSGTWMNPHNLLIQIICELGVVGLAAFTYFVWQIARGIAFVLRKARESNLGLNYEVAIACSVMYLGVLIISMVGHTLYRPYWYLLAGLVAANRAIVSSKVEASAKAKGAALTEAPAADRGAVEPSFGMPANEFGRRHAARLPLGSSQAALSAWPMTRQPSASDARAVTHNREIRSRGTLDVLGSETIFPAQYWTSGSNGQKRGDQG